jgi:hypothetical protein
VPQFKILEVRIMIEHLKIVAMIEVENKYETLPKVNKYLFLIIVWGYHNNLSGEMIF